MKLTEIIKKDTSTLRTKVEYKSGIIFELAYVSRQKLSAMSKECIVLKFDEKQKTRAQTLDSKLFSEAFIRAAVIGWTGLTPRTLSTIVPIEGVAEADMDQPIDFSLENAIFLLNSAYELDTFLQESAVNSELFKPHHEEELGNSKPSLSGN